MRKNLTARKILLICIVCVASLPYFAFADPQCTNGFCALAPVTNSSKLGQLYGSTDLVSFVNTLFTAALSIGAILAVLRLAYAGYIYMASDMWSSKSHAKEVIGDVVLGLLLLLSVYLILHQINPHILDLNVLQNITKVQPTGTTP